MAKTRYLNEMLDNVRLAKVRVKIENAYSDGHESETVELVSAPPDDPEMLDAWFSDEVYQFTGDGHGIDFDGGSCYTATVLDGKWAGHTYEWID